MKKKHFIKDKINEDSFKKASNILRAIEEQLKDERDYAESIIGTIREPLLVLDKDLRVVSASRSFYDAFKVKEKDTEGKLVYKLGNGQWNIPALKTLLTNILPNKNIFQGYEIEHEFKTIGKKNMILNARELIRANGKSRLILLAIEDVTEKRKAGEIIKASNQQLTTANQQLIAIEEQLKDERDYAESIIGTIREPLLVLDKDLRVVSASRSFYDVFKVKEKDTEGKLVYKLGNGQWNIPALKKLLTNILPKKNIFQGYEIEHEFKTIGKKNMILNARELRRANGKSRLILLAIEDATAKRKAEEIIKASTQELTAIEQELRSANQELTASEQELKAANQQLTANEQQLRAANQQLTANEQQLRATNQQLTASEQQVKNERDYAENIVETIQESLIVLSTGLKVVSANKTFYQTFKVNLEETKGRLIYDLGNRQWDIPKLRLLLEDFILKRKSFKEYEIEHNFESIGKKVMLLSGQRLASSKLILISIVDITERKRLEMELKASHENLDIKVKARSAELVRANLLSGIGVFAATIAHELRNPLAAIKVGIYNIRKKINDSSIDGNIENINKKIDDSNQIINNLLFYVRIHEPHYEKVNIDEIIKESVEVAEKRYYNKSVKIIKKTNIENVIIDADSLQIKEVFNNLLNNSFDSISAEKGVIKVEAELKDKDSVIIKITDNGEGIKKEIQDKIFDAFFTTKAKGTGLGLSVCKYIVEIHSGSLTVESKAGKGTTFTITLPLRREVLRTPSV
ncbi:MAG: hypothetical protein A2044_02040 [Candidatus Firestonebacteria bacterium GWA2_43_8]|nr:MAG: hypothetical protein A2044_02040 [Candidatus Firestonebacteria bacterium GWA2_43_8]